MIIEKNNHAINVNQEKFDFRIKCHNLKKYLKVGEIQEILNYTNISARVLCGLPNCLRIFQDDTLMLYVLENCSTFGFIEYWYHFSSEILRVILVIEKPSQDLLLNNIKLEMIFEYREKFLILIEEFLKNRSENVQYFCRRVFEIIFGKNGAIPVDCGNIRTNYFKARKFQMLTELINIYKNADVVEEYFGDYNFGTIYGKKNINVILFFDLQNPNFRRGSNLVWKCDKILYSLTQLSAIQPNI